MGNRVSLKDIAQKVGVSTALVSYVMNGKEKGKSISEDLIRRIRETAEELNYQPNEIARSLRKGSTKTIGLIVADIANPFFSHLARAIENEAIRFGYTVIIGSSDEVVEKSGLLLNTLINRQVDGLIIAPAEGTERQISSVIARKIPLVLVDRFFPDINTNYVVIDNYQSTFNATSYLVKRGFKKIGFITYKSTLMHFMERRRGYEEAMHANNLLHNIKVVEVNSNIMEQDIEDACLSLLVSDNKLDALFFATNMLSIEGLYCIHKRKIKIPEEVGFIGYDGGDCFNLFYSPITYIEQPIDEIAFEAVKILIDCFNNHDSDSKTLHVNLRSNLVIRDSC